MEQATTAKTNHLPSAKSPSTNTRILIPILLFLAMSIAEWQFRLLNPTSGYRPSALLREIFMHISRTFETIGYYTGCLLDAPELLKRIWGLIEYISNRRRIVDSLATVGNCSFACLCLERVQRISKWLFDIHR